MRIEPLLIAALLVGGSAFSPALAKEKIRYEYAGTYYDSLQQCLDAKKKAKKKGAIIGAVGGAATTAIFGGSVGEAALGAGVGAAAGAIIGKNSKKC